IGAGRGLVDAAERLDERGLAGAVVAEDTGDLAGPHMHGHVAHGDDAAEALADVLELEDPLPGADRGVHRRAHFLPPAARRLMRVLTMTAMKRMRPRNRKLQSVCHPAKAMPMKAMPMIAAPTVAPIADPKPPVSRQP